MWNPSNRVWIVETACWPNLTQHNDSEHMLTQPNQVWMVDTACWPNLTKHKDSQHMLTPPNRVWMVDTACWPNLTQYKDSQHMLIPPNRVWIVDTACWPNLTQHKDSHHMLTFIIVAKCSKTLIIVIGMANSTNKWQIWQNRNYEMWATMVKKNLNTNWHSNFLIKIRLSD